MKANRRVTCTDADRTGDTLVKRAYNGRHMCDGEYVLWHDW